MAVGAPFLTAVCVADRGLFRALLNRAIPDDNRLVCRRPPARPLRTDVASDDDIRRIDDAHA